MITVISRATAVFDQHALESTIIRFAPNGKAGGREAASGESIPGQSVGSAGM